MSIAFYQSIADVYHHIFPFSQPQKAFIESFSDVNQGDILDIGCGTGVLTKSLSKQNCSITGMDLNPKMIEKANIEASAGVCFKEGNMLALTSLFSKQAFNLIFSFGNTLVHLENLEEMKAFFKETSTSLKPGGKLLIQIINYDRILDDEVKSLPTIDNEHIKFERLYEYKPEAHKINFKTQLTIKSTGQTIDNSTLLYPLRKAELEQLISQAGFHSITFYGSFKKDPLGPKSTALIFSASI